MVHDTSSNLLTVIPLRNLFVVIAFSFNSLVFQRKYSEIMHLATVTTRVTFRNMLLSSDERWN